MSIRSAAKAIIIKDDQILLNRCRHKDGSIYYDLPGGGQHKYESLEAAVTGTHQDAPTEKDYGMEESEWLPVDQIPLLSEIRPQGLQQALPQILTSEAPVYLGTEFLAWEQD